MNPPVVPRRVLLFSGHMIDAPARSEPRFPPAAEPVAARAISQVLQQLTAGPGDLAICGGANGGDLLFAEAALQRGCPLEVYLPFDETRFIETSVGFAGGDWVARFRHVLDAACVEVMSDDAGPGADPYARNNLRMLSAACRHGSERVDFICLWNGAEGDGPGGTAHLQAEVARRGGRVHWLDTRLLW
jgi:hypothetical protein